MYPQRLFTRDLELPAVAPEVEVNARPIFIDQSEPLVDFWRYWKLVRKRQRLVMLCVASALVLVTIHITTTPPKYTAETTIMLTPAVGEGSNNLENLVEMEAAAYNVEQYYKTQSTILQSPNIAGDVIRHLGLVHRPAFNPGEQSAAPQFWVQLSARLIRFFAATANGNSGHSVTSDSGPSGLEAYNGKISRALIHRYLGMLKVTLVPDTNLLKISFTTEDAGLSAELANAHVEGFQRQQYELRYHQGQQAEVFLEGKLSDIKEQLEKSEAALNDFRRRKGIIPGLISLDGKNAVVLDRLADLSKNLTDAQVERIGLEAQIKVIRSRDYSALPAITQNLAIQGLRKELNDLYAQSAGLSSQFKPDYPPLAKLQSQIQAVQSQLGSEIRKVTAGIQSSYAEAIEKENELQSEINRQRAETLKLNDSAAQYAILQREVDTNRELYNAVLTRIKDVAVASGGRPNNISVVVPAEAPLVPASPKPARELLLGLVLGLSGGIALAFVFDLLDSTLTNPEEAESYLHLPSLGIVPEFSTVDGRSLPYGARVGINGPSQPLRAGRELITLDQSYSTIGECYRNLRTALLLSRADHPPQILLVTSATSREGKTVTSVNTAVMLAQLGKTVLVDADLRRARCHQVLSINNEFGVTEVLTGSRELEDVLQPSGIDQLDFIGSGAAPPNPTELLGSRRTAEILKRLGHDYQYVVIDASPVLPVSDPLLLAGLVDGVVIVANASATPRQQVRAACARIEYARAKVLGIVLNRVKLFSPDYHSYYHGGYYYTIQNGAADDPFKAPTEK